MLTWGLVLLGGLAADRADCERAPDVADQISGESVAANRQANLDACLAMPPEVRACFLAAKTKEDLAHCNAARDEARQQKLADDSVREALYMLGPIFPNELGLDLDFTNDPRVQAIWSVQIPFGISDPRLRHRIVLAFGLVMSFTSDDWNVDFRAGYRYRAPHTHKVTPFVGVGGIYGDTTGSWRAGVSPEVGLHFGRDEVLSPGLQIRVQADFFQDAPNTRILFTIGYTLI